MAKKKRKMTEDTAFEIALRDHPEWRRAWVMAELRKIVESYR